MTEVGQCLYSTTSDYVSKYDYMEEGLDGVEGGVPKLKVSLEGLWSTEN